MNGLPARLTAHHCCRGHAGPGHDQNALAVDRNGNLPATQTRSFWVQGPKRRKEECRMRISRNISNIAYNFVYQQLR